jgi:hypothetical protein
LVDHVEGSGCVDDPPPRQPTSSAEVQAGSLHLLVAVAILGDSVDAGDDRSVEDLADGAGFVLSSDLND